MTKDQLGQLHEQILDVFREDHPQSVRHVFYRMTAPRLPVPVLKTEGLLGAAPFRFGSTGILICM